MSYYDDDYAQMVNDARADAAQEQWDNDYAEIKWQCLEEWWSEALAKFAEEQALPFTMETATYEAVKEYEPFTEWFFEKYADDIEEALKEDYYNAAD